MKFLEVIDELYDEFLDDKEDFQFISVFDKYNIEKNINFLYSAIEVEEMYWLGIVVNLEKRSITTFNCAALKFTNAMWALMIYWHKVIWFKEHIPRNSFMAWLDLLRRLPTRDRLQRWGLNVPQNCALCSNGLETHHHLFFECEFSSTIWIAFASGIWDNPPQTYTLHQPGLCSIASLVMLMSLRLSNSSFSPCSTLFGKRGMRASSPPSHLQLTSSTVLLTG